MTKVHLILWLCLLSLSCAEKSIDYKFFVAGHAYGDPNDKRAGFHPPFADYTLKANNDSLLELGFLAGDFIKNYEFDTFPIAIQKGIKQFDFPVYTTAGNHELFGDYEKYFDEFYYFKKHNEDLFIILTPGLDDWNISGEQLDFLKTTLESYVANSRHIFIILHELIWWSPTNKYKGIKINYVPNYPGSSNFESVIRPLLLSFDKEITMIAGDLGATKKVTPVMYDQDKNLTLIATGMGSWKYDNVIEVNVSENIIKYDIIPLGNATNLGSISDYSIKTTDK